MFIFIPPSETKAFPGDAEPAPLGSLVLPELATTRSALRTALVKLSRGKAATALETLGLSGGQAAELIHNRQLASAPAGPAAEVYTGVLYDTLDLPRLHAAGVETDHVLIFSGLWGVLRPSDRIPHYRCSAGARLPGAGSVSTAWRKALRGPLEAHVGDRLVVDLRSGAYAGLWAAGTNAVSVRVLHEREVGGVLRRTVVSHFNKATKGRIARELLASGRRPRKPDEFAEVLRGFGYTVEPGPAAARPDSPAALDVVVSEL
ncbi:MAG TPA: peroxide stress protein YaaA [Actinospica sp.]|nr:peroxide stress protein YaaA [Actinospica sp.]